MQIYFGYIGNNTNNATKLEGLLYRINLVKGDSKVIIQMEKKFQNGQLVSMVVEIWRLLYKMEKLESMLNKPHTWTFFHVKSDGNKDANHLANVGEGEKRQSKEGQLGSFGFQEWVN